MKNLWQKIWFKVVIIFIVLVIVYVGYVFSTTTLQKAIVGGLPPGATDVFYSKQSGINFPSEFAGFSPPSSLEQRTGSTYGTSGTTQGVDQKVIQTANLTVEVDEVAKGLEAMKGIAKKHGGSVMNANFYETPTGRKSGSITLRVPFDTFDQAIQDIKGIVKFVAQESISAQDVTEEYTDLQSQLKNLRAEEEQYLAIMRQAVKIEDILSVASRLADVRGRIERTQGRINYLDARTDYSLINVQLSEEVIVEAPTDKWRPLHELRIQAKKLIANFQNFVTNIIRFVFWLIGILPYLIVLGIIIWIIRLIVVRRRSRKTTATPRVGGSSGVDEVLK